MNENGGPNLIAMNYLEKGHTFMSADSFLQKVDKGMHTNKKDLCGFADFVGVVDSYETAI